MSRTNAALSKGHKPSSTAITASGSKNIVINISNSIESPHVKRRSQRLAGSHPVSYNSAPSVPLNFTSLNPRVFNDQYLPPPEPAYNPPQMASQIPEATNDEASVKTDPSEIGTEDQDNLHNDLMDRYLKIRYGDYRPNQYIQRKYGVDDSIPQPDHDIKQEGQVPETYRDPDVFERRNADAAAQLRDTNRSAEVRAGVRHIQTQVEDDLQAGQEPSKRDVSTLTDLGARVPTPTDIAHAEAQTSPEADPIPFSETEADGLDTAVQFANANDQARARETGKYHPASDYLSGNTPSGFPDNEADSLSMGIDFAHANDAARRRDNTIETQTEPPNAVDGAAQTDGESPPVGPHPAYQDNGTQSDRPRVRNHSTQTSRPTIVSQGTQYDPPPEPRRDVVMAPASILGKRRKDQTGGNTGTANPVGYKRPIVNILGKRKRDNPYGGVAKMKRIEEDEQPNMPHFVPDPNLGLPPIPPVRGRVRSEVERLNQYTRESNNAGKRGVIAKNRGGR